MLQKMSGQAKLSFLGSATIAENIDGVSVRTEMREWSHRPPIRSGRRRCPISPATGGLSAIYARGVTNLHNHETPRQLHATRYTLAMPRSVVTFKPPSLMASSMPSRDLWQHCRSS